MITTTIEYCGKKCNPAFRNVLVISLFLSLLACGQGQSPAEHLERAKAQIQEGKLNESIIELKNALQTDPDLAEARWLLGDLYLKTGDGAAAQKELERAEALGYTAPGLEMSILRSLLMQQDFTAVLLRAPALEDENATAEMLAIRGEARLGQGNIEKAEEAFQRALELDPDSVNARLGNARLALGTSDFAAAREHLDHIETLAPDTLELWLLRGTMGLANNLPAEAEAAYQQALVVATNNPVARLGLARAQLTQGKLEEAATHISAVNQQYPNNTAGNFLLGVLELQRNDREKAKDALLQVVRADPGHLQALMTLASIYFEDGQLEQAQAHIGLFRVVVPDYLPAQKLAAAIELRLGNSVKAIEVLESVINQASNDAQFYAMLGSAQLAAGNVEKGTSYLSQAAELAPNVAAIKTQLAMGRISSGNIDAAIADLESAVELDPELMQADIMLASIHLQKKDFNKALELAQQSATKHPDNPVYANLAGAAYLGLENQPAAIAQFNQAIAIDPAFTPAMVNLALLENQNGDSAAAKQRFQDILKINEDNVQALVGLARMAESQNDIETTVRHLERARLNNKLALEPRIMLANYYLQRRDTDKALVVAREARDIAPDRLQVLSILGQVESAAGNLDAALAAFGKITAAAPESAEAHYRLGNAQAAAGKQNEAEQSLQRAIELDPENQLILSSLVSLEARTGNFDKALSLAATIREKFPKSPEGFALEGDILLAQEKLPEAISAYNKAYEIQKTSLLAIKLHGAYKTNGDSDAAFAILQDWQTEHPDDPTTKTVLAGSRMQDGDIPAATRLYEEILQSGSGNIVALNNLAWLYHQAGNPRALELAESAYKLNPEMIDVLDTYAWILIEQGQTERGLTLLRKAVANGAKNPSVLYHYASGLAKSGDKTKARQELETVLASNPNFPERAEAEQLLNTLRSTN